MKTDAGAARSPLISISAASATRSRNEEACN